MTIPRRAAVRRAFACGALAFFIIAQRDAFCLTLSASSLSHRSAGTPDGQSVTLNENGYLGTYFTLDQAGPVTVRANASGTTADAMAPRMGIAIADTLVNFNVTPGGSGDYSHAYDLPAGTYFVRTQLDNAGPGAGRSLTLNSLEIDGASSISNVGTRSVNEANALAAADSYIEHFRQGSATLDFSGFSPGTPVEVRMRRNEFNFGAYVTGFNADTWLASVSPGSTSNRARYQDFVTRHFNMLVPSNMGKWQPTENTQGVPTMGQVDTIREFAESHNMSFRQHNLAWGHQQPAWVNDLIDDALSGNALAKTALRQAVIDRIEYYVGDGDEDQNDGDRARSYVELDVINEILREKTYYRIFGDAGIAEIYKLTKDAVESAGAETRLMTNEYNVFNWAGDPFTGASDNYANWYRQHVETLNNAGYGTVVTGIGIQYIVNPVADSSPTGGQNHNTARINQVLQNMAVTGLPVTLTEFSVPSEAFGETTTAERAAEIYDETLRMMYGSPLATSMLIWEPWPDLATDVTTIVDANWNLTPAGQAFVALMDQWTTPTQFLTVGQDGDVEFAGYYGEYEVVINNEVFLLDHNKQSAVHSLVSQLHLPGDFTFDGKVDGADFLAWQRNAALGELADWQTNFGFVTGGGRSSSVPEPSGIALAVAAVWAVAKAGLSTRQR
ncbi:MAG: endo-1,4-beta-xylanase [Planctomycetales bacterium]|nr:endo-1,4-beta-xylanase [Planctomycetales bacterium]